MLTVRDRIEEAVQVLADCSETPRADAEFMMAHLLGVSRAKLRMYLDEIVEVPEFRIYVERRLAFEPVPYILGEWEFFSVPIKTRPPVLVPRPETEHLVEVVLEWAGRPETRSHTHEHRLADTGGPRILELCTGTGCVAIALAKNLPDASIIATDISGDAIALADENMKIHQLGSRIMLRQGDLFAAIERADGPCDVICANPPYVEDSAFHGLSPSIRLYEDPHALVGGEDGLDVIRRIIGDAQEHLAPGGLLALEIGEGQYDAVAALLESMGYRNIAARRDLAGIPRVVYARGRS